MATRKLRFVASAPTGEDPNHPASDLVTRGAKSCGWQSARHCTYPQHLVLDLPDGPARVATLQLLAHEAKIATRVDVSVTSDPLPPTPGAVAATQRAWRRLGALTFDANDRSGHAARELKSVAVNEPRVAALRLTLHEPHPVPPHLNAGRQVGIVAVNVVGDRVASGGGGDGGAAVVAVPVDDGAAAPAAAIPDPAPPPQAPPPPPLCSDPDTAAKLAELEAAKAAAAAAEDYDGAKKAKAALDALKAVAAALDELAVRKAAAVAAEDYDAAKRIKAEMDRVKRGGGKKEGDDNKAAPPLNRPSDPWDERPVKAEAAAASTSNTPPPSSPPAVQPLRWGDPADAGTRPPRPTADAGAPSRPLSADDRPASAGSAPPPAVEVGPPPAGWPADLPAPDPLTDADVKELGALLPWTGPYVGAALRSKAWALRDAALARVVARVAGGDANGDTQPPDRREWARCLARALAGAVRDKVPAVAAAGAGAVTACVDALAAAGAPKDAALLAADALPPLVDRSGDGNARVAAAASAAIICLARGARGVPLSFAVAVRPLPANAPPKAVAARLALLAELLPVVGVSGGEAEAPAAGHHPPLDAAAAMKLAATALTSPSSDVRAAAVRVAAAVAVRAGAAVLALIPADVNPKLRAAVVEEAGVGAGGGAATPSPPARRKAPTPTRAAAAKAGAVDKKAGAAAAAVAADKQAAAPAADKQATAPAAAVAVRAGGDAPAAPTTLPPPLLPTSDPAPYEAELAAREAALGPAHPRVADALCALAAVHAARGEPAVAQRLLGRALGVYEGACGPESTDAAAALTDLGVLHMEAGDDAVGRPLLARALAIQEAAVGRDHPDARAIRAVLEADDG